MADIQSQIHNLEQKLISKGNAFAAYLLKTALVAFSDYKQRQIKTAAASVSFYAIFCVFPLLAFLVYIVGLLIGTAEATKSAPIALKILRDYVPAMQEWIEKGLFDVIKGHAAINWVNALLLGWSSLGLFSALSAAM